MLPLAHFNIPGFALSGLCSLLLTLISVHSNSNHQVIDEDVQRELEEMEKETDVEDILNYRAVAEQELEVKWPIIRFFYLSSFLCN